MPTILDNARTLRKTLTEAEKLLWHLLRGRQIGGLRFRRQVPLGFYIVDFACHEANLIIGAKFIPPILSFPHKGGRDVVERLIVWLQI